MAKGSLIETAVHERELACLLALNALPGVGARSLLKLLGAAGSAESIWTAGLAPWRSVLPGATAQRAMDGWEALHKNLDPEALLAGYRAMGIHLVDVRTDAYPALLRQIYDPPVVLYVRGNPDVLTGKTLAFVGTRRMSAYGRQVTQRLIEDLALAGPVIISGLAAGIDGVAHQAALDQGLLTVAVFGCGVDRIFPTRHEKLARDILDAGGALISEYPPGTPGDKFTFPQRNRIIAGLSHGVVVVEGSLKSGALITARAAMEEGRSVFAVPGNIFSPGSQGPFSLIRDGAVPLGEAVHILQELRWVDPATVRGDSPESSPVAQNLNPDEETVLRHIEYEPMAIEQLHRRLNWGAARIGQALTMLELAGRVVQLPGAKICRT